MACLDVPIQTILGTECIGDSLPKIMGNFNTLGDATCDLITRVNALSSSVVGLSAGSVNGIVKADGAGNFSAAVAGTDYLPTLTRNKLINAQGLINQRVYVSGTATTTANQYTVDRWKVVTSGQNLAFSTTANVVTFTAPAGGVEQVVEGLNVESGTYVLNWTGTATALVAGVARAKGATFSLTGGTNVTVRFSSGTFSLPQLEKGTSATPFEYRPFGSELALCQRYYEKSYDLNNAPGSISGTAIHEYPHSNTANGTGSIRFMYEFKATKRRIPDIQMYNPNNGFGGSAWRSEDNANMPVAAGPTTTNLFHTGGVNVAFGNYYVHFTADAEIY